MAPCLDTADLATYIHATINIQTRLDTINIKTRLNYCDALYKGQLRDPGWYRMQ